MDNKIHHIAQVVKSINNAYEFYSLHGFKVVSGYEKPKIDKFQKVYVGVVKMGSTVIELLKPLSADSPIYSFYKKGGGYHHICMEVKNIPEAINNYKKMRRAIQLTQITKSTWNHKKIVFIYDPELKMPMELIQQA